MEQQWLHFHDMNITIGRLYVFIFPGINSCIVHIYNFNLLAFNPVKNPILPGN